MPTPWSATLTTASAPDRRTVTRTDRSAGLYFRALSNRLPRMRSRVHAASVLGGSLWKPALAVHNSCPSVRIGVRP